MNNCFTTISDCDSLAKTERDLRWHLYFTGIAYHVSIKSKDPSTSVGAVIVNNDHQILSTGYNGFPIGTVDDPLLYLDADYKYPCINHAEQNAIIQCARVGAKTDGAILYCFWLPCVRCASFIIQSGISAICYHAPYVGNYYIESALAKFCNENSYNIYDLDTVKLNDALSIIAKAENTERYFSPKSLEDRWTPQILRGLNLLKQAGVLVLRVTGNIQQIKPIFQGIEYDPFESLPKVCGY